MRSGQVTQAAVNSGDTVPGRNPALPAPSPASGSYGGEKRSPLPRCRFKWKASGSPSPLKPPRRTTSASAAGNTCGFKNACKSILPPYSASVKLVSSSASSKVKLSSSSRKSSATSSLANTTLSRLQFFSTTDWLPNADWGSSLMTTMSK